MKLKRFILSQVTFKHSYTWWVSKFLWLILLFWFLSRKLIFKSISLWSNLELELESLNSPIFVVVVVLYSQTLFEFIWVFRDFFQMSPSISTHPKMSSLISLAFTSWVLSLGWWHRHSRPDPIQHFSPFWLLSLSYLHSVILFINSLEPSFPFCSQ